jgi:hypothetical protein
LTRHMEDVSTVEEVEEVACYAELTITDRSLGPLPIPLRVPRRVPR